MDTTNKKLTEISLADVHVGKQRVRHDLGNLDDLKASVTRFGLFHSIAVKPISNGYQLIAGERRLSVAKILGLKRISAQVYDSLSPIDELDLELEENVRRRDLNAMDLAEALQRRKLLYEELHPETRVGATGGGNHGNGTRTKSDLSAGDQPVVRFTKAVADRFDVSETTIKEWIQLNDLPSDKKLALRDGKITKTEALQVARGKASRRSNADNLKSRRFPEPREQANVPLVRAIVELDRFLKAITPGELTSVSIEKLSSLSVTITEILELARS